MKVVQQLTCLTLGRPNGPAYSAGELLNTPLVARTLQPRCLCQLQTYHSKKAELLFLQI